MAKVGLKETLSLLAAGYKKKDIEALAAIDEEQEKEQEEAPAAAPDPVPEDKKEEEPDYKAMYEELLEKNKQTEAKVTKLQQDNIHKDMAPADEEARRKQQEGLNDLVRSFM